MKPISCRAILVPFFALVLPALRLPAEEAARLSFPPTLPEGQEKVTVTSADFLKPAAKLQSGVAVATAAPTVELLFYPGQNYPGNPWSAWGDSLAANGKYYASIGDHLSIGDKGSTTGGNAFIFEFDPATGKVRQLVDVKKLLGLPADHYTPGKVHGRLDFGKDGWLHFATYRGGFSTTPQYHYKGDWIIRVEPKTGAAEVVAQGAMPGHGIQTSIVDPDRMILYGGTRAGSLNTRGDGKVPEDERFIAYDLIAKKLLYSTPKKSCWPWPIFARSTGRVYFTKGSDKDAVFMRYDPAKSDASVKIDGPVDAEGASTMETPQGIVYLAAVSSGKLWAFDTKTEKFEDLGPACVGDTIRRTSSIDADPFGRYLYYTPGAHGGSEVDGTPIVQFDVRTKRRKVIVFLNPVLEQKYGLTLRGTYSSAVDPAGDKLYVTWNVSRGTKVWDSCALTVIHIPASERP
ncbi:MAG TPA: hypothetical protein VG796_02185 [Verrucomicrobiales bacterium]|nr:hypothetical protein [Verrucomicrobiales bacterium]